VKQTGTARSYFKGDYKAPEGLDREYVLSTKFPLGFDANPASRNALDKKFQEK
jgi:hypothetical protein